MLTAAAALIDAGVPFTDLARLAVRHAEHVERLVDDAIELFVESADTSQENLAEEVAELVPAVAALVSQHFQNTLVNKAMARTQAERS